MKTAFIAQLSPNEFSNLTVMENYLNGREGATAELGRIIEAASFCGLDGVRAAEFIARTELEFGTRAVSLDDVASAVIMGRPHVSFSFQEHECAIYIPLVGTSDVVESVEDLKIKNQNYAQVIIDPSRTHKRFVSRFFNSEIGRELLGQSRIGGVIPRLNTQSLKGIRLFLPDLATQRKILSVEGCIDAEFNTVLALQNETVDLRRLLWGSPENIDDVTRKLAVLSGKLTGGVKTHASENLEQWFETLPFPLASILRAWQTTSSSDYKSKYEHLLHFFEATGEFLGVVLLSAFSTNEALFHPYRLKLNESLANQKLSFERPTFGTWKNVVEYLGKHTRELLIVNGRKDEEVRDKRALCSQLFFDASLALPRMLSKKELGSILATTNKMRNDWTGHGGVVGQDEARQRNEKLLGQVELLRAVFEDVWKDVQLVLSDACRPRPNVVENDVRILMGSNSEFLSETREMSTLLYVERLYLCNRRFGNALPLLPLVQVGPSPKSARNACYFFNRIEGDLARFVSYHYVDTPDMTRASTNALDAIRKLTER